MIGAAISTNTNDPLVKIVDGPKWVDRNGKKYQEATRINGAFVCPDCGLIWPLFEDVEEWAEGPGGEWKAINWGPGYGDCPECDLFYHEGFDCDFVIR